MNPNLRGILFDLDGVIYNAETLIPGAPEALGWVSERGIPRRFVTNTTSRPRRALVEKLAAFGIPATEAEILTPAAVTAEWLRAQGDGGIALVVRPSVYTEFYGVS